MLSTPANASQQSAPGTPVAGPRPGRSRATEPQVRTGLTRVAESRADGPAAVPATKHFRSTESAFAWPVRFDENRGGAMIIRPMLGADADAVLAIYQAGLDGGQASFEVRAPDWAGFDAARLPAHRLVAV